MPTVTFICKDPLLAKHYADMFGPAFTIDAATMADYDGDESEAIWAEIRSGWNRVMLAEAKRQEHYEWDDTDEDLTNWKGVVIGKVRKLRKIDGHPVLLIPTVEVS